MKRDLTLTEAFFLALILLLIGFFTADRTLQRALVVPMKQLKQAEQRKGPIKFTFVDLPKDREQENRTAKLFSDISRRASGGSGAPSDRASSRGNTPEIIIRPKTAPTPRSQRRNPSPAATPQDQPAEQQVGETGREQAGQPSGAATPQPPSIDMSKLFSVTDPEIYNNPKGGLVIPGDFSIDTQGYDLGPYAKKIQQIVRSNWQIPEVARNLYLKGRVEVLFQIRKDGAIRNVRIGKRTGFDPLDKAAELAIRYSNPLPPLPAFIKEDTINVKWTFYYNEQPED